MLWQALPAPYWQGHTKGRLPTRPEPSRAFEEPPVTSHFFSVQKVAHAGEDHREAEAVGGGDDVWVAHGTAGLDHRSCAGFCGFFDAVGKRKERIGSNNGSRER